MNIWIALLTVMVVVFTSDLPVITLYRDTYMSVFVGFTKSWFLVFMLGAVFGHLMDYTGAAGSPSDGMGIALAALGDKHYQLALETGISPEAFH